MTERRTKTVPILASVRMQARRGRRRTPETMLIERTVPMPVTAVDADQATELGPFAVDSIPTAFTVVDGALYGRPKGRRAYDPMDRAVKAAVAALVDDPEAEVHLPYEEPMDGWRYDHDEAMTLLRTEAARVAALVAIVDGVPLARTSPPRITVDKPVGASYVEGRLEMTATYHGNNRDDTVSEDLNDRARLFEQLEGSFTVEDAIGPATTHPALSRHPDPSKVVALGIEAVDAIMSRAMELPKEMIVAALDVRDEVVPCYKDPERTAAFDPETAFAGLPDLLSAMEGYEREGRPTFLNNAKEKVRECLAVVAKIERIRDLRDAPPALDALEGFDEGFDGGPTPTPFGAYVATR